MAPLGACAAGGTLPNHQCSVHVGFPNALPCAIYSLSGLMQSYSGTSLHATTTISTLKMSRSAVVLLLLGAAACAYAAEEVKSSPLFDKWMYQRASTKVHSASYKDIETEHVCLVPKTKENCRCFAHVAADCHNQYSE